MFLIDKIIPNDNERTIKLMVFLGLLGTLILTSSVGIYYMNQYALMAVCLGCMTLASYKECKYILFFLLPLACAIQAFTISIGALLLYVKSPKKSFGFLIPFVILFGCEIIHVLGSNVTITEFSYYASYLFTFFYLLSDGDNITSPRFCTKMFCYGLMISLFAVVYGMISTFGVAGAFSGMFRDGTIIGASSEEGAVGVSLNANSVAYYSLALVATLLWRPAKLKMGLIVLVFGVIIAILAGVISFSRTWIILVALFVLSLFALTSQKKSLFVSLLAAIIIVPTFTIFSDVTEGYSSRFTSDDMQTAGNRQGITSRLFEYMNENPETYIWGAGVLTYGDNTKQTVSPHNATQQIFVCTGLIGLFAFFVPLYKFCRKHFSNKKGLVAFLPFFVCLLDIQTIQFLSPHFLMLPLMACLYCVKPEIDDYEQ